MSEQEPSTGAADPRLGPVRLGIGLAQGLALLALHQLWDAKLWPATERALFFALTFLAGFWPLVLLSGLGSLRRKTLVVWSGAAAVLVVGLTWWDIARQAEPAPTPSFQAALSIAAALFVGHHLVAAGDAARRWIGPYPAYYEAAWKDGVQLGLAAVFVGVFWAILSLGAALFQLIGVEAFGTIIHKDWFSYPATGVVFAGAVHLTDLRAGLTRGVRTVVLALLSWLMPLMVLIAAGFLLALPFTGLEPLWKTKAAANVLLSAAAALILLLNAAYHDGTPERRPALVLRWAGRGAALLIAPMVAIAAYGIALRVGQHGWTPQRIIASACALVGACYALGYVVAAVKPGAWLKPLERTNITTALAILGVIVVLFTPIADPARISVADQVQRLTAGRTRPDQFDFQFLKFGGQRFGRDALLRLKVWKTGPNAALIAEKAVDAMRVDYSGEQPPATPKELAERLKVFPAGRTLPPSFLAEDWSARGFGGPCIGGQEDCDAFFAELDGDGVDEVLLADDSSLWAFKATPDGHWRVLGSIVPMDAKVRQALRAGAFKTVPSPWKDMEAGQRRLRLSLSDDAGQLTATKIHMGAR